MADRYWVNDDADGDFGNANNWSASDGGAGGAGIPGSSDSVYFTANETSNCTLDQARTVTSLTNAGGYTGTLDLDDNDLTTGPLQWDGGTLTPGSATVTIDESGCDLSGGTWTTGTSRLVFLNLNDDDVYFGSNSIYELELDGGRQKVRDTSGVITSKLIMTKGMLGYDTVGKITLEGDYEDTASANGIGRNMTCEWTQAGADFTWTPNSSKVAVNKFNMDRTITLGKSLRFGDWQLAPVEIADGTLDVSTNDYTMECNGIKCTGDGSFVEREGLVHVWGAWANVTCDMSGVGDLWDVKFDMTTSDTGWISLSADITALNDVTIRRGRLLSSARTITVKGDLTLDHLAARPEVTILLNDASATQVISMSVASLANAPIIVINKAGGEAQLNGGWDMTNAYYANKLQVAAGTLRVEGGYTYTVGVGREIEVLSGAELIFDGSSGSLVTLVSDDPANGNDWNLDNQSGSTVSADYVDVQNSNATNEVTATNSTDSGWNTNWTFGGTAYAETLALTATAALSATDIAALVETLALTATATLSVADLQAYIDRVALTGVSVLAVTDLITAFEEIVALTGVAQLTSTDLAAMIETRGLTATAILSATDTAAYLESVGLTAVAALVAADTLSMYEALDLTGAATLDIADIAAYRDTLDLTGVVTIGSTDVAAMLETGELTAVAVLTITDALAGRVSWVPADLFRSTGRVAVALRDSSGRIGIGTVRSDGRIGKGYFRS